MRESEKKGEKHSRYGGRGRYWALSHTHTQTHTHTRTHTLAHARTHIHTHIHTKIRTKNQYQH